MALLSSLGKYKDTGLLVIRVGLGLMFMTHGYPKLMGGPAFWTGVGSAMDHVGVHFFPAFWGLMAALVETFGGFLLIIGLAFRPACLLLAFTMLIAAFKHHAEGGWLSGSHAIELGIVFVGLLFIGPGKISVDKR